MIASELITRALRLINEPGRGASLSSDDQTNAFEALQEILDSEAVSKQFVPGIRRHFFPMVSGQSIYKYGASPQADLRCDDFDDDPLPIHIEDAYIRAGSTITNNELVDEYRFENIGTWALDGQAQITNNQYKIETPTSATQSSQSVNPVMDVFYTLRVNAEILNGSVTIRIRDATNVIETYVLDATGNYEFDFFWSRVLDPQVDIITSLTTDDIRLNSLSIIERGKDRLELPDARGSDYYIDIITQKRYNRRFTKGTGGRPYELLYSRNYPIGEIRFDNSSVAGDILVMDVLVNRVQVNRPEDTIRLHPQGIKWLRFALADAVAGEYGKSLAPDQVRIMSDAWTKLSSSARRWNTLGVDRYLRKRQSFDINRGDP